VREQNNEKNVLRLMGSAAHLGAGKARRTGLSRGEIGLLRAVGRTGSLQMRERDEITNAFSRKIRLIKT